MKITISSQNQAIDLKSRYQTVLKSLFTAFLLVCSMGVWGQTYTYTFGASTYTTSPQTKTLSSVDWDLNNNGAFYGYDATKGQQIGSSGNPASSMSLSTSGISGTITAVKITTSGAASVVANVSVTVAGSAYGGAVQAISATSTEYTFSGSASGAISINWTNSSSKALYFKKIEVIYVAGKTSNCAVCSWNDANAWLPVGVPTATDAVTIRSSDIIYNTNANLLRTAATNVNGAFQIEQSSSVDTGSANFNYGSTGTLIFNNSSPLYGVNSNDKFWPFTNGPINVKVLQGGFILNTGVTRTISGNLETASGISLASGENLTINGITTINPNGFFSSTPIYGNASTLIYNLVSGYNVGNEWTGNATTAGAGTPQNVTLTNSSVNAPTSIRSLAGNLNIGIGSVFNLSGAANADLNIGGNWNNTGTFNPNNKAVFFRGTTAQTITGITTFDYLTVNNAAGISLANSIINNLTLDFTNGKLILGTNDLTIGSGGAISNATALKYVVTNSNGQLKRTVGAADALFAVGNSAYNPITFNNTGGTSDVYGVRVADGALTTAVDNSKTVTRKWIVSEAVSGGSNLKVVAQYNSGEEDTNFIAGTAPKIGFYDGTNWTDVDAVKAGSNPYTFTSNSNISPTTLSGTQYFALGKDNAFLTTPTKYVITAITPSSPGATYPFAVKVQAQDAFGFAANVTSNSTFALTTNGNAGTIGGTVTGTILSGTNSIVVNGLTLSNAGTGVTVTATRTAGLTLTPGTSSPFTVLAKATKLVFVGVPSTGSVSANLSPFTVEARRPDNTIDTFYTGNITIAKASGSGTLSGTSTSAAVAGIATFSDAQFNAADTYTLTTTASGLTADTSGNIVVTLSSFVNGDYRTNPSFGGSSLLFSSTTASGGIYPWQKWNGSNWIDVTGSSATAAPENLVTKPDNIYLNFPNVNLAGGASYNNIIVDGGYLYSGNTSVGLTLNANKTLDIKAGYVKIDGKLVMNAGSNIYVRTDSEFKLGSSSFNFTRNATSNLIVEDDGYLYIDNYLANVWTGNENFAGESYVAIYGWDRTQKFFDSATDITNNSTGSKFGYLDIDLGTSGITGNWTYVFPADNFKLTNKDFELINSTSNNISLNMSSMSIGGDFTVGGTGNIQGQTQAGTKTISVGGNFIKNGSGNFRLLISGGADVSNLNVDGNFSVNDGFFVMDNSATEAATATVNLKGNLYKATGSYMTNSNTNSTTFAFNFIGNSPQTVNLSVNSTFDMLRYYFYIKNGAYVKPITQDWKLATDSKITVESGGILDFGFVASTPLNVITNNAQVGMTFNVQSGGTLKITSPAGINKTGISALGNVQTPLTGRTFDKGAIYHYIGKENQVTGNGIPDQIIGKLIVELGTQNATQDDLEFRSTGTTTFGTASGVNGILEIRKGKVIDEPGKGFRNFMGTVDPNEDGETDVQRGDIIMSGGRYVVSGAGTKPSLSGIYTISAGTVEFTGSAATKIRTSSSPVKQYYNVDVSGTNVESGGKSLIVNNLLKVTDALAVFTVPKIDSDGDTPNVVTAKKGLKVSAGKAIFKNNSTLIQDIDAANEGVITMERNATVPTIQYNYWSSPVVGQNLYSLYSNIPANTVMEYNSLNDKFKILPPGTLSIFAKGYSIKGPSLNGGPITAIFVGEPNNETTAGINTIALSTLGNNYNLIGNPYPSNLNLLTLYNDAANKDKFYNVPLDETPTAYFWDNTSNEDLGQLGTGYTGQNNYALLNLSSGIGTSAPRFGTTGKKPNGIVKPGQGFIIRAVETGGSLTFRNSFRTALSKPAGGNDGVYYKGAVPTTDKFWLNLTTPNNVNIGIAFGYNPEAEDSFERFDSAIISDAVSENLYSLSSDSKKLAIQSRKGDFIDTYKISLGIKTSITGTQKISIDEKLGVFENQPIYLKDNLLNMITDLSASTYEFTSSPGVDHNRFEIVFKPSGTLVTTNQQKGILEVYRSGEYFVVKSNDAKIEEVEVYDAVGRLYQKVKGGTVEVKIDAAPLTNGLYVLKIKRNNETISKKIIK